MNIRNWRFVKNLTSKMHLFHNTFALFNIIVDTTIGSAVQNLIAVKKEAFDNRIELTGSVADIKTWSLLNCMFKCLMNDKCLTMFYHSSSKRCVMHSKDFVFSTPSMTETGWEYYITRDISGRCPPPIFYYRNLNFCYTVDTYIGTAFSEIKSTCSSTGGTMASINSQEMQDYFNHVLSGRNLNRVCLGGTLDSSGNITLDNGSVLSFYNWASNEPNIPANEWCYIMSTSGIWYNVRCVKNPQECTFVCEVQ